MQIPSISESIHTESDLYEALGLKMIHPCLRENSGEIEAASENKLPKLVTSRKPAWNLS